MSDGFGLPVGALMWPLVLFVAAAVVAIAELAVPALRRVSTALTIAGGVVGVLVGIDTLLAGRVTVWAGWSVIGQARFDMRLDALAAAFLLIVSVPAIAAAIYALGLPANPELSGGVALFLASLVSVVLADNVYAFLVGWEAMALLSFLLAMGRGHNAQRRQAAISYLAMTHIATIFLVAALLGLARHAGSFDFSAITAAAPSLSDKARDAIFLCALVGFGTKAGLVPLHVWRPRLYPHAPAHVTAIMSAGMAKLAIYGLLRLVLAWDAPGPRWWGVLLIAAGATSALLGVLYSLVERDMTRVLAYSTVEHLGILTMGIGVAVVLMQSGHQSAASLAVLATLVHALNHAAFKALLYLGAGAVQHATGTRDLERLGGLIRRMPRTAAVVLVGCAAAAALPPLNGFAGEWLLFQSMLGMGHEIATTSTYALAAGAAAALAMTGALAVVCFVRLFGVGFLATPRTVAAADAVEVPVAMRLSMGLLAAICVVLGLGAPVAVRLLGPAAEATTGGSTSTLIRLATIANVGQSAASYAPMLALIGLVLVGIVPWVIARLAGGPVQRRIAPPWVCGVDLEARMPYTATAFTKVLRIVFAPVLRAERTVVLERAISPWFVSAVRYEEEMAPIYDRAYHRFMRESLRVSRWIRPLQNGSIRAYLTYVFVTLVVAIVLAR